MDTSCVVNKLRYELWIGTDLTGSLWVKNTVRIFSILFVIHVSLKLGDICHNEVHTLKKMVLPSLQMLRKKHAAICTYLINSSAQELKSPAYCSYSILKYNNDCINMWLSKPNDSFSHINCFSCRFEHPSVHYSQSRANVWTTALALMNRIS